MAAPMVSRLFCRGAHFISQHIKQPMYRVLVIENKNTLQWAVAYSSRGRNSIEVSSLISINYFAYTQVLSLGFVHGL